MNKIVECVPNISEGRNNTTIEAVAAAIRAIPRVKLLGVEPDKDYNRSVITFVGPPEAVLEAAIALTKEAVAHIDMTSHKGEHPRIGAVDVVPFIPVRGVSMEECVKLARSYAKRISSELNYPIYLYEAAATHPNRKNLADIRKGEYEGLEQKLQDPEWKPDFGPSNFVPKTGATVAGARKFLVAYNVNLNTPDSSLAQEISFRVRESGRVKKDSSGATLRDEHGQTIKIPGTLKSVKAMGVFLERFKIAQVSINLTDYEITPPHVAFEEVRHQAQSLGIDVTGSEIVGLIPLEAILAAGKHFLSKKGSDKADDKQLIETAVEHLGLSQLELFVPEKKIIEYQL